MKRVTAKLYVQDPTSKEIMPVRMDPDSAQVTQEGKVLVKERHFNSWRDIGSVPDAAIEDFMRGENRGWG